MKTLAPNLVLAKPYKYGKDLMFHDLSDKENTQEILNIWHDYTPVGIEYGHFTFPGCYQIHYYTADNGILCAKCANDHISDCACPKESLEADDQWRIVAADVNYEDNDLYCDHCNDQIKPEYGD